MRASLLQAGRLAGTIALVVGLFLWSPALSLAGRLVIDLAAEARIEAGRLLIGLAVTNRGDEAALNLQAESLLPEGGHSGLVKKLEAGQTIRLSFSLPVKDLPSGRHLAVVRVNFQDLNEYPFSALTQAAYHWQDDVSSPLIIEAKPLKLAGRGRLKILLRNPETQPAEVELRLFTPKELEAKPASLLVKLPGRGQANAEFELANFSGLAGADYPIVVVAEQMLADRHAAKAATVMVSLTGQESFFKRTFYYWLAAAAALAGVFVYLQFRGRRRA